MEPFIVKSKKLVKGESVCMGNKFKLGIGYSCLSEYDYDIGTLAFLIGSDGKLLSDDYLVFYNSKLRLDVKHPGVDDEIISPIKVISNVSQIGENDEYSKSRPTDPNMSVIGPMKHRHCPIPFEHSPDDQTWDVELSEIHPDVVEIVLCANIYEAKKRKQDFAHMYDMWVRLFYPFQSKLETEYLFRPQGSFNNCGTLELCRIYKEKGSWKFKATGVGYEDFEELCCQYIG